MRQKKDLDVPRIVKLYSEGHSIDTIAKELEVSPLTVRSRLEDEGLIVTRNHYLSDMEVVLYDAISKRIVGAFADKETALKYVSGSGLLLLKRNEVKKIVETLRAMETIDRA